ncbi:MAG: hypothetical protein ACE14M_06285 [Terriglobales bacterium]
MRRIPLLAAVVGVAVTLWAEDMAANEQAALNVTRSMMKIQRNFMREHPGSGYACRISDLGAAGLVDPGVASGKSNGYKYELRCPGKATPRTEFEFVARPQDYGHSGNRIFCTTQQGQVFSSSDNDPKTCLVAGQRIKD